MDEQQKQDLMDRSRELLRDAIGTEDKEQATTIWKDAISLIREAGYFSILEAPRDIMYLNSKFWRERDAAGHQDPG
jgi:hypothetical protein